MFIIVAIAGFIMAWCINILADVLPQYAMTTKKSTESPVYLPASMMLLIRQHHKWIWLHLCVEWGMAALFVLIALRFEDGAQRFGLMTAATLFILIAVIDVKYRLILNVIIYPAIMGVIVLQLLLASDALLNIAIGGMFAFSIFYAVAILKPGDLGGGDVKLAALIGLIFGFPNMLWALIVGGTVGALAAIYLVMNGSSTMRRTIPYAPFLCAGAIVALMYNPLTIG